MIAVAESTVLQEEATNSGSEGIWKPPHPASNVASSEAKLSRQVTNQVDVRK